MENAGVTYVVGQLRANVLIGIELRAIARQRCDSLSRPHRHQLLELDGARGRRRAVSTDATTIPMDTDAYQRVQRITRQVRASRDVRLAHAASE